MTRSAVSRADLLCALQLSERCQTLALPEVDQVALAFQWQRQETSARARAKPGGAKGRPKEAVQFKLPLRMPSGWHGELVLHDDDPIDAEADVDAGVVEPIERPSREEAQAQQRVVDRPQAQHVVRAQLRASVCQVLPWQGEVHWVQAVQEVAKGKLLTQLPRRQAPRWPAQLHVLVDSASPSVASFRHEIEDMLAALKRAVGTTGLVVHRVGAALSELQGPRAIGRGCTGQRWLVLGDGRVGEIESRAETPRVFSAWVHQMMLAQNQVVLMGPLHVGALPALPRGVVGQSWSSKRAVVGRGRWWPPMLLQALGLRTVIALVYAFGQVSQLLLRAFCQLVVPPPQSLATEWAAWNFPFMQRCGAYIGPSETWRVESSDSLVSDLPLPILQAARHLQRLYQHALPEADLHLTTLRLAHFAPQMAEVLADEVNVAKAYLRQVATQTDVANSGSDHLLQAGRAARMVAKAGASLRTAHAGLFRRVATRAYRDNLLRGEAIPQWAELGTLHPEWITKSGDDDLHQWMLQMDAQGLSLREDTRTPSQARAVDVPIGFVSSAKGLTLHEGGRSQRLAPLHEGMVCHVLGPRDPAFELDFGQQSVQMGRVKRPHWAAEFAQRFDGLEAMIHLPDGHEFWVDPLLRDKVLVDLPSMDLQIDSHGPRLAVWMFSRATDVLDIITVSFRYLPPATFLMGSPDGEGAGDEHPQHPVTLTQALWMAETPCTQALWQSVMGQNPSHFKQGPEAPQRPVENVSWDDVQRFLAKLNRLLPEGCEAVLPTEAQWEYACRAGTATAYWWGDEPDDSKANFDSRGDKDWDAKEGTTPVDRYPPNPWGLRDMHGNVLEWCADGEQRTYEASTARDPIGDTGGDARLLRGGSWFNHPVFARSAARDWRPQGSRLHYQGFRFALRSSSPQGAEPQPGGLKADQTAKEGGAAGGRTAGAGASGKATRATPNKKGVA